MESINKDLFKTVSEDRKKTHEKARPSFTYWQDVWRRFKSNKLSIVGLVIIIIIVLFAVVGPIFSKFNYYTNDYSSANLAPNGTHIFGTDNLGRDLLTRVMWGGRISLTIALVASIISFVIGIIYGGISGYFGGTVDNIMMRIVEGVASLPLMIYVILIMVIVGQGMASLIIAIALTYWVDMARIVRGQILQLKQEEFVLAAKTLGASSKRILLKHLLPNTMGPIIVNLTLNIPNAIFTEAFLSFVGLGVPAPQASWGTLCSNALGSYQMYPYQLLFPALALCVTMFGFNFLGDGLSTALDPKMRK
ncbi:ABC transporter permease [Clostridium felsineum]|uniref:Oligopeptide transport system permease protein OppC n=1 Tax=Clostridium felsineum TaxID=36839 RepID=A0A1S8L607_9CLOT|nr:ABC transporter permease [Clostridium felsineum]MCR3761828.1 ABC transporter permease [Clostridium felsineum]URZ02911.1 Oligopeptide transport system permease protein OppC [Clostridium felsineum]URZ08751.1 Oligopeptide transport system permease protein OppC [Clostridium felsineum]URZ09379.1 Oligopeptide transport system permease protein OppC [Clostridium felsineum]URZ14264.1 Oligopeptide transport system permease protein OppC [Clostridium felsineum DSM 794]